MKTLYVYTLNKSESIVEKSTVKNADGAEVTTSQTVTKEIPKKFVIKKPTRVLIDEARLFYGSQFAKAVKNGFLPLALLSKRFKNDEGTLSDDEKKKYADSILDLEKKQKEFSELTTIKDEDKTQEQKDRFKVLLTDIDREWRKIQEIQNSQTNLFNQTAESYAREQSIIWWILHLSYNENEKNEHTPFFGEGDVPEKLKTYDKIDESDDLFLKSALQKFIALISFWYVASNERNLTEKDFDLIFKLIEKEDLRVKELEAKAKELENKPITPTV